MSPHFDDPVAAYDRLAPSYKSISARRESYLRSVEKIIASRIPADSRSLMDVGAGDGMRAFRIAKEAAIGRVVLVEPSLEMASSVGARVDTFELWPIRAEQLETQSIT